MIVTMSSIMEEYFDKSFDKYVVTDINKNCVEIFFKKIEFKEI